MLVFLYSFLRLLFSFFSHYSDRSISRSYTEFTKLIEAISATCPQSIVPALPLSQTSAGSDEEEDRVVKNNFQKWCARITTDKAIMKDDELRSFIEAEFGVCYVIFIY